MIYVPYFRPNLPPLIKIKVPTLKLKVNETKSYELGSDAFSDDIISLEVSYFKFDKSGFLPLKKQNFIEVYQKEKTR